MYELCAFLLIQLIVKRLWFNWPTLIAFPDYEKALDQFTRHKLTEVNDWQMFSLKILYLNAMISVKNVRYIYICEWDCCTLCHSQLLKLQDTGRIKWEVMEPLPNKSEHHSHQCVYCRWRWNRWRPSACIIIAHTSASIMGLREQIKTFNYSGCSLSRRNNHYGHTVLQNTQEIFGTILCLNKTKTLQKLSDNGSKKALVRVWKLDTIEILKTTEIQFIKSAAT
jgi:hypothetical protein